MINILMWAGGQIDWEKHIQFNHTRQSQKCDIHNQTCGTNFPIQFEFIKCKCHI